MGVALLLYLLYTLAGGQADLEPQDIQTPYKIEEVVDGDTIRVRNADGQRETVRLIGIDAHELSNDDADQKCFGGEAKDALTDLALGKYVSLEVDPTQDDLDVYGRLLRYATFEDGTHINEWMLEHGYAEEYEFIRPYEKRNEFVMAEARAKKESIGLWNKGACN